MAFITIKTNVPISKENEATLTQQIGQTMMLIGQNENALLLNLESEQCFYLRGKKQPTALISASIFANSKHIGYRAFAEKITQIMAQILPIPPENLYIQFNDLNSWAVAGQLIE